MLIQNWNTMNLQCKFINIKCILYLKSDILIMASPDESLTIYYKKTYNFCAFYSWWITKLLLYTRFSHATLPSSSKTWCNLLTFQYLMFWTSLYLSSTIHSMTISFGYFRPLGGFSKHNPVVNIRLCYFINNIFGNFCWSLWYLYGRIIVS